MAKSSIPRTYRKWSSMCARCYQQSHPAYPYYGGRGITVYPGWRGRGGYKRFLDHIGPAPDGFWLDRIDNSLGYFPGNVRWVTPSVSANNRRKSGPPANPKSLRQLALTHNIPYPLLYSRVKLFCWPLDIALSTPPRPRSGRPPTKERQPVIDALKSNVHHQAPPH